MSIQDKTDCESLQKIVRGLKLLDAIAAARDYLTCGRSKAEVKVLLDVFFKHYFRG